MDGDTNSAATATAADDHLEDVEAGAGCTEIWEHLSERRSEASD